MNWKSIFIRIKNGHIVTVVFPKNYEEEYELSFSFGDNQFTMHVMLIEGNVHDGGKELALESFSAEDYNGFVAGVESMYPQVKELIAHSGGQKE